MLRKRQRRVLANPCASGATALERSVPSTPEKTALTSRYATKSQMTFTKKTTSTTMVMGLAMAPPFSEKLFEPR